VDYNNNPDSSFSKRQRFFLRAANIRKQSMEPKAEAEDIQREERAK